jgi:ClpP class serine protease
MPDYAISGGTLIALAASEIVMSEDAMLGPVDPQLGQYPLASILKAVEKKPVERVKDDTLILADQVEKAVSQIRKSVCEFLAPRGAEKASELAKLLSEGTWTHDHRITFETAQSFGLAVRSDMPQELFDLNGSLPAARPPSADRRIPAGAPGLPGAWPIVIQLT